MSRYTFVNSIILYFDYIYHQAGCLLAALAPSTLRPLAPADGCIDFTGQAGCVQHAWMDMAPTCRGDTSGRGHGGSSNTPGRPDSATLSWVCVGMGPASMGGRTKTRPRNLGTDGAGLRPPVGCKCGCRRAAQILTQACAGYNTHRRSKRGWPG